VVEQNQSASASENFIWISMKSLCCRAGEMSLSKDWLKRIASQAHSCSWFLNFNEIQNAQTIPKRVGYCRKKFIFIFKKITKNFSKFSWKFP
jgi:hypothetical protein